MPDIGEMYWVSPPGPGGPLRTLFFFRRIRKTATAIRATKTATPEMVPPTIAPVLSTEEAPAAGAAPVSLGEFVPVVVGGVVVGWLVDVVDELAEVEVDEADDDDEEDEELVKGLVPVLGSIVIGVETVVGSAVRLTSTLDMDTEAVMPEAVASTVAARSLAVPHPYCDAPPPNWFL